MHHWPAAHGLMLQGKETGAQMSEELSEMNPSGQPDWTQPQKELL